jgi:hypothetical protein
MADISSHTAPLRPDRWWPAVLTTVIAAILIPEIAAAAETPRLVVLVSVDQLPARYLTDFRRLFAQDGIFARIESRGACFTNCHHRHAFTLTGPGHSTMMTGADPARTGIISNAWYDRRSGKTINCVEDAEYPIVGGMSGEKGVSPRNLLAPTVGDTLKLSTCPRPKVFGISWKDRAGVLMAGHAADACFWFDEASGNWVTSRYYRQDLPGYLRSFNEGSNTSKSCLMTTRTKRTSLFLAEHSLTASLMTRRVPTLRCWGLAPWPTI